jgi:hypothetical protein
LDRSASAKEDWEEDLARAHADVLVEDAQLDVLNYPEFSEAMFQLVDTWCEHVDSMELFVMFLRSLFEHITVYDRTAKAFRYKSMNQIRSLADRLDSQREVHLSNHNQQEALRLARREESQARRGVVSTNKWKGKAGVMRTSLQISLMGGSQGLGGSVEMQRDGSMLAAAEVKPFAKNKLRAAMRMGAFKGLGQGQAWQPPADWGTALLRSPPDMIGWNCPYVASQF